MQMQLRGSYIIFLSNRCNIYKINIVLYLLSRNILLIDLIAHRSSNMLFHSKTKTPLHPKGNYTLWMEWS